MPVTRRPPPDKAAPVRYLQGAGNYTWQHLRAGNKQIISTTLKKLLANYYPQLLRIHKAVAVNIDQVVRIIQDAFNPNIRQVELKDGKRLPISRRQYPGVRRAIGLRQRETLLNPM